MVEIAVRTIKKGTSCTLVQSGLDEAWLPQAMKCFCFLKNVVDLLDDERTADRKRFCSNFSGPLIPFVPEVTYLQITDKEQARLHEFGTKVLSGIFL